jgi:hypothetical protein
MSATFPKPREYWITEDKTYPVADVFNKLADVMSDDCAAFQIHALQRMLTYTAMVADVNRHWVAERNLEAEPPEVTEALNLVDQLSEMDPDILYEIVPYLCQVVADWPCFQQLQFMERQAAMP